MVVVELFWAEASLRVELIGYPINLVYSMLLKTTSILFHFIYLLIHLPQQFLHIFHLFFELNQSRISFLVFSLQSKQTKVFIKPLDLFSRLNTFVMRLADNHLDGTFSIWLAPLIQLTPYVDNRLWIREVDAAGSKVYP